MEEGAAGRGSEAEELSLQIGGTSSVLLRRFMAETERCYDSVVDDSGDLELSLGLSLGGRFGIDPNEKRLVRSSSIAGLEMLPRDLDVAPPLAALPLNRTCSLPTETEEEWRKRKEMQSLRRLEAKRKRSEKQRSYRPAKDRDSEEEKRREEEVFTALSLKGKTPGGNALPNGFFPPAWAARGADAGNTKSSLFGNSAAAQGFTPSSQGSLGSQGSSSSGVSDMDSRAIQGSSNCMEAKSPASIQSLPERIEQKVVITAAPTPQSATKDDKLAKTLGVVNPYKKPEMDDGVREMERNVMEEMPCVFTKGDGPNGRRIEGFLYKYRKGEEVSIVCVCHGSFLSPAEFVRHAGGGDVAHPLRHIVVNPTPSSLL